LVRASDLSKHGTGYKDESSPPRKGKGKEKKENESKHICKTSLSVASSLLPRLSISYRTAVNMSTTTAPLSEAIASVTALYNDMQAKARPLVDNFESCYSVWKQICEK
jgi:hypothetical protein